MRLSFLSATALAAAIIAAASVLVFSELPSLFVWAAFIGWASYDHSGATPPAAVRSSAALVFGVMMAWLVAVVVTAGVLPMNTGISTALAAGLASFLIVAASRTSCLSVVPGHILWLCRHLRIFGPLPRRVRHRGADHAERAKRHPDHAGLPRDRHRSRNPSRSACEFPGRGRRQVSAPGSFAQRPSFDVMR
jgi:Protein of unknown function (DUF1097)